MIIWVPIVAGVAALHAWAVAYRLGKQEGFHDGYIAGYKDNHRTEWEDLSQ